MNKFDIERIVLNYINELHLDVGCEKELSHGNCKLKIKRSDEVHYCIISSSATYHIHVANNRVMMDDEQKNNSSYRRAVVSYLFQFFEKAEKRRRYLCRS